MANDQVYFLDDNRSRQLFPATWLPWNPTCSRLTPNDVLVVHAHALTGGQRIRSGCGGLRQLETILADPNQNPGGVAVVSLDRWENLQGHWSVLEPKGLLPFQQWPLSFRELEELARTATNAVQNRSNWLLLRLEVSSKQLELKSRAYSHPHKNVHAAVRLFLGALQLQHVDTSRSQSILEELATKDKLIFQPDNVLNAVEQNRKLVAQVPADLTSKSALDCPIFIRRKRLYDAHARLPISVAGRKYRVIVLDDQPEWSLVLGAISGIDLECPKSWEEAKTVLEKAGTFDVMLLDCHLGERCASGLELLHPLRQRTLDLPIVMFTAEDHAELALTALRAGCNDFFAKELRDTHDRSPLDYYVHFLETIQRRTWEVDLRQYWKQFIASLPASPEWNEDEASLRYSFYLLFSLADGVAWWAKENPQVDDLSAVEEWVAAASVASIVAAENISQEPKLRKNIGRMHGKTNIANALTTLRKGVDCFCKRHSSNSTRTPWVSPEMPANCRFTKEMLRNEKALCQTSGPGEPQALGHLKDSRLGAAQLVLGSVLSNRNDLASEQEFDDLFKAASQDVEKVMAALAGQDLRFPGPLWHPRPTIVLVDDEAAGNARRGRISKDNKEPRKESNGWEQSLGMVLGRDSDIKCFSSIEPLLKDIDRPPQLVLLDLWLPKPQDGLRALAQLKRAAPGLPVIMLSAATDTVNAKRALRAGALDYVPKWLPHETRPDEWRHFAQSFVRRIEAATKLGRDRLLQVVWRSFVKQLDEKSVLDGKTVLLQRVTDWKDEEPKQIVRDWRRQFYQLLLPGFVVYANHQAAKFGILPAMDAWRYQNMFGSLNDGAVDDAVVLLAGRACEYLAKVRYSLEVGKFPVSETWKEIAKLGRIGHWTEKASEKARIVWEKRNAVKHGNARHDPNNAMMLAWQALVEFEGKLARDERDIILTRRR